jgi:hypothetical protein
MARWSQAPPSLPPYLPPARYQVEPHLRYDFPSPRPPRLRTWRTRLHLWRRRFRWWQARWGQRLLDKALGVPRERPEDPALPLRLLVTALTGIVLFEMFLLILASR